MNRVLATTHNTFLVVPELEPAVTRARALRRNRTDGDSPEPTDVASPPGHLRRLDDAGNSAPGSQDSQPTTRSQSHVNIPVPSSQESTLSSQMARLELEVSGQGANAQGPRRPRRRAQLSPALICAQCEVGASAFQAQDDRGLMLHICRAHLGQQLNAAAIAQLRSLGRAACQICSSIRKLTNPRCDRCGCATPTRALILGDRVPDTRRAHQRPEEAAGADSVSQQLHDGAEGAAQAQPGLDVNDSKQAVVIRRVALSEQAISVLGSLKRASDFSIPQCIAARFAHAWTESMEGAMEGNTTWSTLCRYRSCLILAEVPQGSDRNEELKRRLRFWERGEMEELVQCGGPAAISKLALTTWQSP